MLKVKFRVLLSLFCVVFSCALTILYLYISSDELSNSEVIATTLAKSSKDSQVINVEEDITNDDDKDEELVLKDDNTDNKGNYQEQPSEQVEEVKPAVVYEGMTLDELASKLDRSLKNDLAGKGYLYASYSLEKGVDPYLAVAISLEETGCNYNCSTLVKSCNNVGGMKGSGCGAYGYFNTLDDGIKSFIDNISRNYVAYGLTTAELMNSKYAENPAWSNNVNNYISIIRSN